METRIAKRPHIPPKNRAALLEGARLTAQNALRLSVDARLLFDNGRLPSSLALGLTALEECGKVWLLVSQATLLRGDETVNWGKIDGVFRSHDIKQLLSRAVEYALPPEVQFRRLGYANSELGRQAALYVNAEPNGWGSPASVSREDSEQIVKAAQLQASFVDQVFWLESYEKGLESALEAFRGQDPADVAWLRNEVVLKARREPEER